MEIDGATVDAWPERPRSDVPVRTARREDLPHLGRLLPDEDLGRRMSAGDLGMVAEEDGRVVGCTWLATSPIRAPHWRMTVRPHAGEAYCYGLVVAPEARRRGVGRALFEAVRREGRRRGVRRFVSHVGVLNTAALALQRSEGGLERRRLYALVLVDLVCVVVLSAPVER